MSDSRLCDKLSSITTRVWATGKRHPAGSGQMPRRIGLARTRRTGRRRQPHAEHQGYVICFSDTEVSLVLDWCDEGETGAMRSMLLRAAGQRSYSPLESRPRPLAVDEDRR